MCNELTGEEKAVGIDRDPVPMVALLSYLSRQILAHLFAESLMSPSRASQQIKG